jgi:signal-transduction protein with cAMP-binding, CBS, and nucleotidyltransferase domain/predicted metal-dependent phosphoesterase TrpH
MIWFPEARWPEAVLNETLRINLHCHSDSSDGDLSPEDLAERLSASGVRAAALTDHDSLDGQAAFRQALTRRSIACLTGIELTASIGPGLDIHLLGYGFDLSHSALTGILARTAVLKRQGNRSPLAPPLSGASGNEAAGSGALTAAEGIAAVHEAGGLVFWAHPLDPENTVAAAASLEPLLGRLKDAGIDGLEAYYGPYSAVRREDLAALADRHGLLTSAGSDYHGPTGRGSRDFHVDFPADRWRRLRDALLRQAGETSLAPEPAPVRRAQPRFRWRPFVFRILMPTLLAVSLFAAAMFAIFIPSLEKSLMERKRDTIRELTNIAFGILAEYETDAKQGRLTQAEAQLGAADRIRNLRYGAEGKDYFWIQDLRPRMIMHPYRADLEGGDLTAFKDPRGVAIFLEFVRVLSDRSEAYVEYVWQWKDNPERLAPKQSFIKKFEPWGWIVSAGLYPDDVRAEIKVVASRLIRTALAIAAICGLLLFFVAGQSLRIERNRERVEEELHESHEKYRTLVESGTEGTLVVVDGRLAFANSTLLDLLGYRPEELPLLELADLVTREHNAAPGPPASGPAKLRRRNGQLVEVGLASARVVFGGREALVLSVRDLGGERRPPSRRDLENQNLIGELQASLLFLREPIASCAVKPLLCELRQPVSSVAARMTAESASAAVVMAEGEAVGILTDRDIRARLVAEGKPADRPVHEFMSSPLVTIGQNALVFEAILAMRENDVDHLLVRDENGRVAGLLRNRDLLLFPRFSPAVMTQEIRRAPSVEAVAEARRPLAKITGALVRGGAKARNVTRAVTAVTDASSVRLIELAEARLGPPPIRFAFLALGSQGREEQTLATDQDHALLLEDYEPAREAEVAGYFSALGEAISEGLFQAGYPRCPGKVMADNPRWRQPLRVWAATFEGWLASAEPEDILGLQVFFDFRTVVGDKSLALELRRRIDARLAQEPPFLLHYALYALQYKIPRLGGRVLNMKDILMPVVNFARLYAFKNGIPETHTLDRLRTLLEIGMIKESLYEEAGQVYDQLMGMRLAHQARCAEQGRAPNNELETADLTHLEETLLRQALSQMGNLQKKISFDFLGSA